MPISRQGSVAAILCRALNYVDERLAHHGDRVAYLVMQMMQVRGGYSSKMMQDLFMLALLHDIGAYKTEEIDKMVSFETVKVWEHSIYGALLMENFAPLKEYSQVILFHHMDYAKMGHVDEAVQEYAQLINLADRIDVFFAEERRQGLIDFLEEQRDKKFCGANLDLFYETQRKVQVLEMVKSGGYKYVVEQMMRQMQFSEQDVMDYLQMLVWVIDFRSALTATHSVTTACIAKRLSELLGIPREIVNDISLGALLHDLGKIAVPVEILEAESALSPEQQEIMRRHVIITGEILGNDVRKCVYHMAVRHHERLNGSGYPKGLTVSDLTLQERVVAVANVISTLSGKRSYKQAFTKDRCSIILNEMIDTGKIDPEITRMFMEHYDEIMTYVHELSAPLERMYRSIRWEFDLSLAQWGTIT